jgi:hypothetical protein
MLRVIDVKLSRPVIQFRPYLMNMRKLDILASIPRNVWNGRLRRREVRRAGSVDAPNNPDGTEMEGEMKMGGPTFERAGGVEGASAMGTSAGSCFGYSIGGVASIGVTSGVLHTLEARGTAAARGCWMVWETC